MYLARLNKRSSVKVRIDGPDAKGANTSRQIMVCDATVEEVEKVIRPALEEATKRAAQSIQPGECDGTSSGHLGLYAQ
jgi:hypothetical protein